MPKTWSSRFAGGLIAAVCAVLPWIPVTASAAREISGKPEEAGPVTAPVMLDGDVLFRVRGVTALPAEERAHLIAERIRAVAADPRVAPDSLRLVETEDRSDIMAGDHRLATVVDADAEAEDVGRRTLAATNLQRIQEAIETYRRDRHPDMLRWAAVRSAVAL